VVIGQPREAATRLALARAFGRQPVPESTQVTATHAKDITVALATRRLRAAVDLQCAPDYGSEEWRLMLGEGRMRFAMQLLKQGSVPNETQAFLYAWTLSECLIKLGVEEWPLAMASQLKVDAAFIGPVLKFTVAHLRLVVTALDLPDQRPQAVLAVAVAVAPATVNSDAGEQVREGGFQ
jgi:hypothetical protein